MDNSIGIHKLSPPGVMPGFITLSQNALPTKIELISYDKDHCEAASPPDLKSLTDILNAGPEKIHWIAVKGFGNLPLLQDLAEQFQIHRLQLEDVINVYQRPKLEDYPSHLFLISRMLHREDNDEELRNDQLSLMVFKNLIITFHEKYDDILHPVVDRLKNNKGMMRTLGPDYLGYAVMDAVVDHYYPILERLGEELDDLELELLLKPRKELLRELIMAKRILITFRRIIWGERDKINDLLRTETALLTPNTKIYLKDTYDHTIQILDLVESYKEITSSMMDIYLSSVSNRMNQIMKVLAVISTIFIPLTFIVGVYGMNFAGTDPNTGKRLPLNMPELYSPYGYVSIMGLMLAMVMVQLYIFYRKGWLS